MNIVPLPLESQFKITKFKLYLQKHPEDSSRLATDYCEDFLALAEEYKKLQARYRLLESQYSEFIALIIESR